jgi:hypothetical protein
LARLALAFWAADAGVGSHASGEPVVLVPTVAVPTVPLPAVPVPIAGPLLA